MNQTPRISSRISHHTPDIEEQMSKTIKRAIVGGLTDKIIPPIYQVADSIWITLKNRIAKKELDEASV